MEAQDDGDGGPDQDVHYDEDGDDSDAVGGDRMKKFRLRGEFDRGEVMKRHDGDGDVKTQNCSKESITGCDDDPISGTAMAMRTESDMYSCRSAASSLAYSTAPLFLHLRVIK